jgi:cobalt-zinc-cadmium efflux system membrane fusion protein
LDVFERDLEKVLKARREGDVPVEIRVKAFPDLIFRGKLDHVGSVMSEETRTVKVRAIVENKDQYLRPGMFCEAYLYLPSEGEVLVIPKEAILSDEGVDFVFRPFKDDTYYRVNVVKGRETSKGVEIVQGLADNDTLVGQGAFLLKSDVLRSKMGAGCAD